MFGRTKEITEAEARYQHQLEWLELSDVMTEELGRPPTIEEIVWARHVMRGDK